QTLLYISGNYVRAYGLTITRSGKQGIVINGNDCWLEECEVFSNWQANIVAGIESSSGRDVNRGTILYCSAHHSRLGAGISLRMDNRDDYNLDGWTIKRCL